MPSASIEPMRRAHPFWLLIASASLFPALLSVFTSYINSRFGVRGSAGAGVGLSNTRARLETRFGETGQLRVACAEGGGTIATLRFPLKRRVDE